ncbi:MAG: hypothetical protein HY820_05590 [Acidobacteria bacterium]|nr:hypothetical protein [Acidobacteriota bacterium]
MRACILFLFAALAHAQQTVIIDAEDFFHEIPQGDLMADATNLRVDWVHRNTAITLRSKEDAVARGQVPAAGLYHLYVRSQGQGSFRISVNGKLDAATYGTGVMQFKQGGQFQLAKGPVELRLTGVTPSPSLDVIVLTTDTNFLEPALKRYELPASVKLLKEYKIPRAAATKFGDVTGDGKTDYLVIERDWSAHMFDHDGRELWSHQAPEPNTRLRAEFEPPGSVWDFDQDGKAEVVHWRMIDGKEALVMVDGATGAIRRQVDWPTPALPHVYNNFRLAIGRMKKGYPDNLIVYTDSGGQASITAYTKDLQQLWQHIEHRLKDHLGHYVYPVDLNGDGVDEVVVSHLALNAGGKVLWNRFETFIDNHDHIDNMQFADIDGDGRLEILAGVSDLGVIAFRALTGETVWTNYAAHSQQIQFGNYLAGKPAPQIAVTGRIYGDRRRGEPYLSAQVHWFQPDGERISIWPKNPLNGNPDFVKGDWLGNGRQELFWFKFHMKPDGRGEVVFNEPVYHMFDFMGWGAEEAITQQGGILRVYGAANAVHRKLTRDAEYRRIKVANHTHY